MSRDSDLHDEIVEILFDLCKEHKTKAGRPRYSSVYADHIGRKYKPKILSAYTGKKKKPLAKKYNPDVWARLKGKNLFDVFEVWHSETEAEAVEDILLSALMGGIRFLHVVCTGQNLTDENADELVSFILHSIHNEEGKKLLSPGDVYVSDLPERLLNDKSTMKKYLKKELVL